MTFVEKQHSNDLYYISVSVENNLYVVQVCPRQNDHFIGYPIRKITYALCDKKQAYATYRRYIKRYTDN